MALILKTEVWLPTFSLKFEISKNSSRKATDMRKSLNTVFAINKQSGPSSAAAITSLKKILSESEAFKSEPKQNSNDHGRKRRKGRNDVIKIGHGGTLDPLASGVLVIGIGSGTKQLTHYLSGCTKVYEAVALFGCSTTTYDSEGKVLKRAKFSHLTDEKAQKVIEKFQGEIIQIPPIFSALKMDGKPLYEYARQGLALPRQIEARKCTIDELNVGPFIWQHEFKNPIEEASESEKLFAEEIAKRTDGISDNENIQALPNSEEADVASSDSVGPILRLKFSVSSGTYIRTLIHDIGLALGSAAHMVELVRLRQGPFELGKNVMEVDDFDRPEEDWLNMIERNSDLVAEMAKNDDKLKEA